MSLATMTPESWSITTGRTEDELAAFVKRYCRIHNIRHFLSGEEQLGKSPKLLIIDSPQGKTFFLVSLRPDYPERV